MLARMMTAIAAVAMVSTPIAATAATVTGIKASAVSGNAFVSRNGAIVPLRAGDQLRAGDRVMTRAGSTVAFAGCGRSLGASSMVTLNEASCAAVTPTANLNQVGTGSEETYGTAAIQPGFSSYAVAFLAVAAMGLGLWAALDTETDDAPVSP